MILKCWKCSRLLTGKNDPPPAEVTPDTKVVQHVVCSHCRIWYIMTIVPVGPDVVRKDESL